jgi:hypothetical protein
MLALLRPGGYFLFVLDAVVPDDQRTADHVNEVRPENEGWWRAQNVRQDDKGNNAGAHNGETYCQRSDHGGSLAKHQIKDKDQGPKSQASSETTRGEQLDLLHRRSPQNGQCSHHASQEAGRYEHGAGGSGDEIDDHAGDWCDSSETRDMHRP